MQWTQFLTTFHPFHFSFISLFLSTLFLFPFIHQSPPSLLFLFYFQFLCTYFFFPFSSFSHLLTFSLFFPHFPTFHIFLLSCFCYFPDRLPFLSSFSFLLGFVPSPHPIHLLTYSCDRVADHQQEEEGEGDCRPLHLHRHPSRHHNLLILASSSA